MSSTVSQEPPSTSFLLFNFFIKQYVWHQYLFFIISQGLISIALCFTQHRKRTVLHLFFHPAHPDYSCRERVMQSEWPQSTPPIRCVCVCVCVCERERDRERERERERERQTERQTESESESPNRRNVPPTSRGWALWGGGWRGREVHSCHERTFVSRFRCVCGERERERARARESENENENEKERMRGRGRERERESWNVAPVSFQETHIHTHTHTNPNLKLTQSAQLVHPYTHST